MSVKTPFSLVGKEADNSTQEWRLRKAFLVKNFDALQSERLECLSNCFVNHELYGGNCIVFQWVSSTIGVGIWGRNCFKKTYFEAKECFIIPAGKQAGKCAKYSHTFKQFMPF
ncbi:unnamed protein product [Taenia asiatica]|uniref:XRN2-binding (XTBD) domain-containing protein n=1 Tax=Taenia asiatica TaxID=60517 RepID=A0A0R3VZ10_TAEAS|nr:unnamed protein product [Taenia asiatica]